MKTIIDKAATAKGLNLEICLIPCNIPYGKKEEKLSVTAVEVLVDRASVHTVQEMMIELFQTKQCDSDGYLLCSFSHTWSHDT